jgi:MFS family permease
MRTTEGKRQVSAMTLWSTATPAAISLGMLLSGSFAGTQNWRMAFLIYAVAFALAGGAGLLLPKLVAPEQIRTSFSDKIRALSRDIVKPMSSNSASSCFWFPHPARV